MISKLFIIFGLCLFFLFQNCSNVNLSSQENSSSGQVFISGKICYPAAVRDSSLYKLTDFYVINLTARSENGVLKADSNMNSVLDYSEETLNKDAANTTVLISNKDSDGDGVPDFIEKLKGFNVNKDDMNIDGIDGDGITNKQELQNGTDPLFYDSGVKNIDYKVSLDSGIDNVGCGTDQLVYKFDVSSIKLVAVSSFADAVNTKTTQFTLSHNDNENVVLIMYKLRSENINNPDLFYGHVLKLRTGSESSYMLSPKDFSLIPN